jgi:hypothetical protein
MSNAKSSEGLFVPPQWIIDGYMKSLNNPVLSRREQTPKELEASRRWLVKYNRKLRRQKIIRLLTPIMVMTRKKYERDSDHEGCGW